MRAALLTAQRMADSIVKEAEEKRDSILQEADSTAREKLESFQKEAEQYAKRLRQGQEEVQRFVAETRALCEKEMKFLDEFPSRPLEVDEAEEAGVVEEIEEKILSAAEAAAPVPEPIEPPAPTRAPEPVRAVRAPEPAPEPMPAPEKIVQMHADPPQRSAVHTAPTPSAEKLLDTLAAAEEIQEEDLSATRRVNINELKFGPNYRSEGD